MSYSAFISNGGEGELRLEAPRYAAMERALEASIPTGMYSKGEPAQHVVHWRFNPRCIHAVREIVAHHVPVFDSTIGDPDFGPDSLDGWRERWARFKRGERQRGEGTPLVDQSDLRHWLSVLHLRADAPIEVANAAYRALSKMHHADIGGDSDRMAKINEAIQRIRESRIGAKV